MKILIVGSKGMLGSDLVSHFSRAHQVQGLDLPELDISQPQPVQQALDRWRPEVVINAAAYTNVDGAEAEREQAFAVNETGPANLAKALRGTPALLVHYSTDYVFDGSKNAPYTEGDPTCPQNVYGASKLAGEKAIASLLPRHLILRTAWLYGKNGKNFVNTIQKLAREKKQLRVVNDQLGSPTYTRDLVRITEQLIAAGASGIVNATNSGQATWYEFAREIVRLSDIPGVEISPCTTAEFPRPAKRPKNSRLDLTRCQQLAGQSPRPWGEALLDFIQE